MASKKGKKIYQACEQHIFNLFKSNLPSQMVYHDFRHSKETADACVEMIDYFEIEEQEEEQLIVAAWFHDTGYTQSYEDHESFSAKIAEAYLLGAEYSPEFISGVKELILSTKFEVKPKNLLEEVLHDADHINLGKKRFFRRAELLRLEWERFKDVKYDDLEWMNLQLEFLESKVFLTQYAAENYASGKAKNLLKQSRETSKAQRKENKMGRGIETMYRSVYRNHISLSSIADSKANMMISVNTIIVSVIVAGIGSTFTFSGDDFIKHVRFTVPIVFLLVGVFISAVYAILSALPSVTNKKVSQEKIEKSRSSVLFFGNFVDLELDKFVESLKLLREESGLVYDNMSVDIYHLGHVLKRKYRLLNLSYMIFLGALTLCVVSFLLILVVTSLT